MILKKKNHQSRNKEKRFIQLLNLSKTSLFISFNKSELNTTIILLNNYVIMLTVFFYNLLNEVTVKTMDL